MLTLANWIKLPPDARLLVYVLQDLHDQGFLAASKEQMLEQTGLDFLRLKAAAHVARDLLFVEKVEAGVRLTAIVCMETAIATRPKLRKVKDENKLPPGFLRLWQIDPRGASRAEAIKEFVKLNPDPELLDLMVGKYAQQIAIWAREGTERNKIPHLRTWLSQKRWTDEIKTGFVGTAVPRRARQNDDAATEALRRRGFASQ